MILHNSRERSCNGVVLGAEGIELLLDVMIFLQSLSRTEGGEGSGDALLESSIVSDKSDKNKLDNFLIITTRPIWP